MRAWLLAALCLAACSRGPFDGPRKLGGATYSATQLNHGFTLYQRGCRACHGDAGDGHGASARGLWPPPRDLTQALYKFGRVPTPGLPPDGELGRIVRGGLAGTAMLPWTLSDDELHDLLGYVKTFAPRWSEEFAAEPVAPPADPYASDPSRGVAVGEALFHGKAMCSTCHPAYVTRQRLSEIGKALGGDGAVAPYTPQMYESRIKETEYCWRWGPGSIADRQCEEPVRSIPPDFLHDPLRAVRPDHRESDLYLTLASGIPGAGMPPWKGALSDDELWAMAHYVGSLVELRGTARAAALTSSLRDRANVDWKP